MHLLRSGTDESRCRSLSSAAICLWPGEEAEEESQGLGFGFFFFTAAVMQQDCLLVCMPVPY